MFQPVENRYIQISRLFFVLLISLFLCGTPLSALAQKITKNKLVLLTSLAFTENPFWVDQSSFRNEWLKWLENQFFLNFQNFNIELVIIHQANAYQLWTQIRDPRTVGLIWISHADAHLAKISEGIQLSDVALAENGQNVLPILLSPGPHLKWLAILGCKIDKRTISKFSENQWIDGKTLTTFSEKVEIQDGFLKALSVGKSMKDELLKRDSQQDRSRDNAGFEKIYVRRSWPRPIEGFSLDSVAVKVNDKVVSFFAPINPGQTQEIEVEFFPQHAMNIIEFDSGYSQNGREIRPLGTFQIESLDRSASKWQPFVDINGKIISVGREIWIRRNQP